jgi:pyruvoyl-dependent arginine decarboxylase (PvlArgDC)
VSGGGDDPVAPLRGMEPAGVEVVLVVPVSSVLPPEMMGIMLVSDARSMEQGRTDNL